MQVAWVGLSVGVVLLTTTAACGGRRDTLAAPRAPGAQPSDVRQTDRLPRQQPESAREVFPQGLTVSFVSEETALLWSRAPRSALLKLRVESQQAVRLLQARPVRTADNTVAFRLSALERGKRYVYRLWDTDYPELALVGTFRTPGNAEGNGAAKVVWGADIGGQGVCRDSELGYPIFTQLESELPDLFIALGDMIYADSPCPARGLYGNAQVPGPSRKARTLDEFRAYWRYHRADPAWQRLTRLVPWLSVWDDHEVQNDYPTQAAPGSVAAAARLAHRQYLGLDLQAKLYRSLRWGRHLELFLLDLRSHRQGADGGATMLGAQQRDWLIEGLLHSTARWKVVASSVPLALRTGTRLPRDGWAQDDDRGYEAELRQVFEAVAAKSVRGVVFVTADVHFASGFCLQPADERDSFRVVELGSGPLHAEVVSGKAAVESAGDSTSEKSEPKIDHSFRPQLLYWLAPAEPPSTFAEALKLFNYGVIEIDAAGDLRAGIINARGKRLVQLRWDSEQSTTRCPAVVHAGDHS